MIWIVVSSDGFQSTILLSLQVCESSTIHNISTISFSFPFSFSFVIAHSRTFARFFPAISIENDLTALPRVNNHNRKIIPYSEIFRTYKIHSSFRKSLPQKVCGQVVNSL